MEQLADMEESGVRRSSRNRSSLFDSFDQKDLDNSIEEEQPIRKRRRVEVQSDVTPDKEEYTDIYSRVKRQRKVIKRDMYGMPIETDNDEHDDDDADNDSDDDDDDDDNDDNDENEEEEEEDNNDENENDDDDKSDEKRTSRSYNLREKKPRTQHYIAPIQAKRQRNTTRFFQDEVSSPHSPARRRRPQKIAYMSPARKHRAPMNRRRRAFHGSSSTSSSSSDSSSSDEERFQRRKAKSMLKARQRCLPMNFDPDDISRSGVLRDRQKIGSSLADVDPMAIDRSVTFDSVGGLGKHVRALKEMVVFPLMYPEIFERFKIAPPRGVLFYGPPGTGKTLMARALANECSTDEKRVAFYMRKGADCLSKWVGESERQLRLLFDQAYQTRPSIIFFDEIDGLAPVRSSRQDQIHSSIVSTLLALMDGLDSRGEIVVIGATNRLDSIDPALRRPGRFDREFLFPLPSVQARSQILKIHTKEWNPRLCDKFVSEVAEKCIGYCGADMKALCTEVALLALRRRYPQIYTSSEKLQIDVTSININAKDFYNAMQSIVPASQRSVTSPAKSLDVKIAPLLQNMFLQIIGVLNRVFPSVLMNLSNLDAPATEKSTGNTDNPTEDNEICSDYDDKECSIYEQKIDKRRKQSNIPDIPESFMNFKSYAYRHPSTHRPRLLLSGNKDQGQTNYLAPAVIHHLEQLPVHTLDISTLYACSARSPEESCAHIFREAKRTSPSIIYLPHINNWWSVVGETVRSTLLTLIHDLDPSSPVLLLATSEETYTDLEYTIQDLFDEYCDEVYMMRNPNSEERREYFKDLLLSQATKPPPTRKLAAQRALEILPKAPPPEPRKLTDQELKKLHEHEEATLTELRLFLRDVLNKLGRDRKFFIFTKPVDVEDVPDYYDIIKKPMDLSTMMSKIDLHHYQSVKEFLADINQICLNALEYNPDKDPQSRVIRHRACALKDTTKAIIQTELDSEFEKLCENIVESRKRRGEEGTKTAPSFYHTRPLNSGPMHPLAISKQSTSITKPSDQDLNIRVSRRLQGAEAVDGPSLEDVERNARALKRLQMSPEKEKQNNSTPQGQIRKTNPSSKDSSGLKNSQEVNNSGNKSSSNTKSSSARRPARKDIWGKQSYRSRKKRRFRTTRLISESDDNDAQNEADHDHDDDGEELVKLNDIDIDGDKEDMETDNAAIDNSPVMKSPKQDEKDGMKSPRRNSLDKSTEKMNVRSRKKDSLNECLSVDVTMKSPKDGARSPTSQRSPRSETQKSPQVASRSSTESPKRSRSPRADSHHTPARHSSGMKSPRTLENSHESDNKSKSNQKSCEKQCKNQGSKVVHDHDEASNQFTVPHSDKINERLTNGLSVEGFVDSGVGSSDSNGDSNDSVGKLTSAPGNSDLNAVNSVQVETSTQEEQTLESNDASQKEAQSPVFHITRSRAQTKAQEKAIEILNEQQEPFIVDREKLVRLLDNTVLLTQDYVVPRLEKLYSLFAQCIYEHRKEFNKTEMILDMERRLKRYTTSVTERMKREQENALLTQ
ncbi:ATPase AAA domain-containing protein 2 [Mactra antiquata]